MRPPRPPGHRELPGRTTPPASGRRVISHHGPGRWAEVPPSRGCHLRASSRTLATMAPMPSWMWCSAVSHMKAGVVTTLFFWST